MLHSLRALLRCLPALLASGAASAADVTEADFLDDLPVVLSVSRLSQPVNEAPAAVTVIDQDLIRASGFRDIPDLLRLVPGFVVAYTRDNTWAMGYHGLGDAYSRRLQVLVDGRSIYSPHYGAVYWNDLPLAIEDIERIEVVRGPNAAIHGANAFAAVVNIITKAAAQVPGTLMSVQAGESGMRGLVARHAGGDDTLRYRLSVSTQQRDRFERDVAAGPPDNVGQYFEASKTHFLNGRFDWQLAPDKDLSTQFGLSQGDWRAGRQVLDNSGILEPTRQDSRAQYLHLAYRWTESPRREWHVQAYHTRNRFDADTLANLGGLGTVSVDQYLLQTRTNLELQVNETWSADWRGVWGAEVRHETVEGPQTYNTDSTFDGTLARVYGNAEWRVHPAVLLQGGAMLEHHYFTGTDISPRVAASFTLQPGHVVRLGVSRAFRSPTFFEEKGNQVYPLTSGAILDVVTVPSNRLKPERVLSRELAYLGQWKDARVEWDVRLFDDRIEDFIGNEKGNFAADGALRPNEFRYGNIGKIDAHGGEIQLRWRPLPVLDVSAHYARTTLKPQTRVGNFNEDIPLSAPRSNWGLLALWRPAPGWETSLGAWHYDDTKWLSEGDMTQNYTRIDARIARRWRWQGQQIEAALVGQNLGEDYAEFRDTNVFTRRVYGSLSLAW